MPENLQSPVKLAATLGQLINPHKKIICQETKALDVWQLWLKKIGLKRHSHKLMEWVYLQPVYIVQLDQGMSFGNHRLPFMSLLEREKLTREDFVGWWLGTTARPRQSLLQHLQNCRHTIQIGTMMWFHPLLAKSYDYQEVFQSFCDFLHELLSMVNSGQNVDCLDSTLVDSVVGGLWSCVYQRVPAYTFECEIGYDEVKLDSLLGSYGLFVQLVAQIMRLDMSVLSINREVLCIEGFVERYKAWIQEAIWNWSNEFAAYDTVKGPVSLLNVFADFQTYLSYRLFDASLKQGFNL